MSIKQNKQRKWHTSLFLLLSTALVLIGGAIAWSWQLQQEQRSRADGGNIIGGPSLPAETVDAIFRRVGSPMAGTGKVIEQASRQTNIDDAFALAVWWTETNDGEAGVGRGDRNPGGVRASSGYPADATGYTLYPSYEAAVIDWFAIVKGRYINRGLISAYTICYPYVGTPSAGQWAIKVMNLVARYRGEAPPPPTPTPVVITPTPTPIQGGVQETSEILPTIRKANNTEPGVNTSVQISTVPPSPFPTRIAVANSIASPIQTTIVVLGLVLATLLALWSVRIRKCTQVLPQETVMRYRDPITPLPPIYVNEFSPVLEGSSLEIELFARQTDAMIDVIKVEQLSFAGIPLSSMEQVKQVPFPGMSLPGSYSANDSITNREPHTEAFPQRMMLPSSNTRVKLMPVDEASLEASTASPSTVPVLSGNVSPHPTREGGLLKRYGAGK